MKYLKSKYKKWGMFAHVALMYISFVLDLATDPDIFTSVYGFFTLVLAWLAVMHVRGEDRNKELELLNGKS